MGRALKDRRDRAVPATKVGVLSRDSEGRPVRGPNGRPEHVRLSIDESLGRLGTDHVDLWVSQGEYVMPIPGAKTLKYLLDNAAMVDTSPTP
ncbi:aldo/keto reductase [Streptomyces mirabilis]|uniref:aldo/keto reductase n=1 Tax=Streptomyces mirabilis TaxID=68239 RepID=UPI0036DCC088